MKISSYYKSKGNNVKWYDKNKHYDKVYKSKAFTDEYSKDTYTDINADEVIIGGTGYNFENKLSYEIEHTIPDYNLYDNPKFKNTAYGFLTRGCPRGCPFCIVSKKEGRKSIKVAELSEFWNKQKNICLLDPNLLACKEHERLLKKLIDSKSVVDFSQGLDARLIMEDNAELIGKIKYENLHFAFDNLKDESAITRGLNILKSKAKITTHNNSVYILTNYNTTLQEDWYRVCKIQSLGYRPYIMVYNKSQLVVEAKENPSKKVLHWLQRWCNNKFIYHSCNFVDFSPRKNITIKSWLETHNIKL